MSIELKDKLVTLESLGVVYDSEVNDRNAAIAAEATARAEAISAETAARNAAIVEAINQAETGAPTKVELVSQMTDPDKNYLYIGEERGYNSGHIYYLVDGAPVDKGVFGGTNIDDTLTISGQAADAKVTGDKIEEIKEDLSHKTGLSEEVKQALLACLQRVAWIDENGGNYYNALESALYPPANITRIAAVYTQSGPVYIDGSLDALKSDLVVTAYYDDSTERIITNYTLTGSLNEGVNTVTVHYGGFSAVFNVTVSSYTLYSLSEPRVFTGANGDVINTGVVVMPEDRDITITLSATPTEEKDNRSIFYAGYTKDNFESITIRYNSNSSSWGIWTSRPKVALNNIMNNEINKIVIRHRAGSGYDVDYYNSTNGRSHAYSAANNTVSNESLVIGGARESILQQYNFVGTIHDFTVYTRRIDDNEVTAYLGG